MNKIKIDLSIKTNWIVLMIFILMIGKITTLQIADVHAKTTEITSSVSQAADLLIDPSLPIQPLSGIIDADEGSKKEEIKQDFPLCSTSESKTYMFYQDINEVSAQMDLIRSRMTTRQDGLLMDEDGFLGVALGSAFGSLGTRYVFTLDSGIELSVIKIEEKADQHTFNGCQHQIDGSVIEFVLDETVAPSWFGVARNGYINSGNFNNHPDFQGSIIRIQKVIE